MKKTAVMLTENLRAILLSKEIIEKYRKVCGYKAYKEDMHNFIVKEGLENLEALYKEKVNE